MPSATASGRIWDPSTRMLGHVPSQVWTARQRGRGAYLSEIEYAGSFFFTSTRFSCAYFGRPVTAS